MLAAAPPPEPVRDPAHRPHVRATASFHRGVVLRRLQLRTTRVAGGRLRIGVRLSAKATGRAQTVVLHVGRCAGGSPANPMCPPALRLPVRLPAGTTVRRERTLTVRAATAVGAGVVAPGGDGDRYGEVLLRATAWTGFTAGRWYGLTQAPSGGLDLRELRLDIPAFSPSRIRPQWSWEAGVARDAVAQTDLVPCGRISSCAPRTWRSPVRAGTTAGTGHRATLQRPKRGLTILLDVRTTGARSAGSVLLPYPDPPPGG